MFSVFAERSQFSRLCDDAGILTLNLQTVAVFLKYSPSCGKLFAGIAKCTSTVSHCSPKAETDEQLWNILQLIRDLSEQFVTTWGLLGERLVTPYPSLLLFPFRQQLTLQLLSDKDIPHQ